MKPKRINSVLFIVQLILFIGISTSLDAQSRKERDSLGITEIISIEADYMDSNGKEHIEKIERYNEDGRLIEVIDYDNDEKIKEHIQYEYEDGLLLKEIYFDHKDRLEKYFIYTYDEDGLLISKKYFDAKDNIYRERKYQYKR